MGNLSTNLEHMSKLSTHGAIMRDALGIGVGVASYGVSFGALCVTSGLDVLQAQTLSALMFTGASQFALVGVLAAGGGAVSAIATALLLGFRNMAYALRMNILVRPRGVRKLAAAHLTIDESTAMGLSHLSGGDGEEGGRYAFWATGISVFVFWNLATLLGALAASIAGDPKVFGLDSAIGAGFIALLWPQLNSRLKQIIAACGLVIAFLVTPFVAPGLPILIAGCVALAFGLTHKIEKSVES
jgi:predicted branched-subunit amino acid permease